MKQQILFLGKTKDSYLTHGIDEYLKRLKHYTQLEIKILKEKKGSKQNSIIQQGRTLLEAVPKGWLIVALDAGGKQFSSEKFAELIDRYEQQSIKGVCYLIGGPLGLSKEALETAQLKLSLSAMTFTHDMVRLLLLEQIYRAYTIKAGEKYHK